MHKIEYEEHVNWFKSLLEDPLRKQYILEKEGIPIGSVRINIEGESAEISYLIAEKYRGKGYGTLLLRKISDEVTEHFKKVHILKGVVKKNNIASRSAFQKNGFEEKQIQDLNYVQYVKYLN